MERVARILCLALSFSLCLGVPERGVAQNTGAPDALIKVLNDVKLGVQLKGGAQYRRRNVIPYQRQTFPYRKRRVEGTVSHSVPYYGVGVTLKTRGARAAFTYLLGHGVQSAHWLQFREGGNAIPYEPKLSDWAIRAEYFVFDWIGVGASYQSRNASIDQSHDTPIDGDVIGAVLFGATILQTAYSAYMPFQKKWKGLRFFGRMGASVYGRVFESYTSSFVKYQSKENPGYTTIQNPSAPTSAGSELGTRDPMSIQFGRVGVEVPVGQTAVRTIVGVERTHVPDLSTTWSYDVQLEVGLPF